MLVETSGGMKELLELMGMTNMTKKLSFLGKHDHKSLALFNVAGMALILISSVWGFGLVPIKLWPMVWWPS